MKTFLAFVALFLVPLASGQDVARPKVPDATTLASKTSQIKAWYLYAVSCEQQIAALKAQLASAQSAGSGTSGADIAAIKAALASIDSKVTQMLAKAEAPVNVAVTLASGNPTISWDYPENEQLKVREFAIMRAQAGVNGDTPQQIGFAYPSARTWKHSAENPPQPGNWLYYVLARTNNYLLIKDSPLSNPIVVNLAAVVTP